MIGDYCNQTISVKIKGEPNENNEAVYTNSTIQGRFEYKRRIVRDKQGQEVVSEAKLFTETSLKTDDIVIYDNKEWSVMFVMNMTDLDGDIVGYEVLL